MQTYRDIEITPAANGEFSVVLGGEEFVECITDVRLIIDEVLAASFYYRASSARRSLAPNTGSTTARAIALSLTAGAISSRSTRPALTTRPAVRPAGRSSTER